jgi:hypothetical protein
MELGRIPLYLLSYVRIDLAAEAREASAYF